MCVYHCVQSVCLILRSSPIHPLILLTYSPNPVIPRFFFARPFIHLSLYPFISRSHPLLLCLCHPFQLSSLLLPLFPPLPPVTYLALPPSLHPSGPSSSQTQQMSESLASGLFFRRVQSLPYENAVQGTALSSLQIKRLLTIQW